jgi:CDP-glycerol glycerophosphotransferase (TagB/SpsB family)
MVISGYLIKIPYWLIWQMCRLTGQLKQLVFYVDMMHDYYIIENILPHLKFDYCIATRNHKLARLLRQKNLPVHTWPVFPRVLIMARHSFHRFPIKSIKKIGLRHGPYQFKKMISASKYNAFDLYLFTSDSEVATVREKGIICGVAGGYPRLDSFFKPETITLCQKLRSSADFDENKKSILFTATWDNSGLSAIDLWVREIGKLTSRYNVMVSLHPMMGNDRVKHIQSTKGIIVANAGSLPACMLLADFLVGDTSSVIAEFCALDKPIITFEVPESGRLTPEIRRMIREISLQISNMDQLEKTIERYLNQPELKKPERQRWNKIFFDDVNVSHGEKAAEIINTFIAQS